MNLPSSIAIAVIAAALPIVGCGRTIPSQTRHPVHGTVTQAGKEVQHGSISFLPRGKGPAATTVIVDGQYAFTDTTGPYPGNYRVIVGVEWHNRDGSRREGAPPVVATPEKTQTKTNELPPPPQRPPQGKVVPLEDPAVVMRRQQKQASAQRRARYAGRSQETVETPKAAKTQWEFTHSVSTDGDDLADFQLDP